MDPIVESVLWLDYGKVIFKSASEPAIMTLRPTGEWGRGGRCETGEGAASDTEVLDTNHFPEIWNPGDCLLPSFRLHFGAILMSPPLLVN